MTWGEIGIIYAIGVAIVFAVMLVVTTVFDRKLAGVGPGPRSRPDLLVIVGGAALTAVLWPLAAAVGAVFVLMVMTGIGGRAC